MTQQLYRLIYDTPLNGFITGFCRRILGGAVQIPPSGVITVPTYQGVTIRLRTNQTCHVTKVLYYDGYDGYEYSEFFCRLIKHVDVFFDIGANIGYYSIMGAAHNPALRVYAFDPSPGPYRYLVDNISLNGFGDRIHPFELALSDSDGELEFSIAANPKYRYLKFNSLGGGGHITSLRDSGLTQTVRARTTTLDAFVAAHQPGPIGLIKIDAENAEHLILAGARQTIARDRPMILTEVFSREMAQLIEEAILPHGYRMYLLEGNQPKPIDNLDVMGSQIENIILVADEPSQISAFNRLLSA